VVKIISLGKKEIFCALKKQFVIFKCRI
jgi:hypothetical protein